MVINKNDCKTIHDHARRLADIYKDCGLDIIVLMEAKEIAKENNYDYDELIYHVYVEVICDNDESL